MSQTIVRVVTEPTGTVSHKRKDLSPDLENGLDFIEQLNWLN